MFYAYTNTFYCFLLWHVFSAAKTYTILSGRLLAIPIGVLLLTLQILVRFSSCIEVIVWILKESFLFLFFKKGTICSLFKKYRDVLKEFLGLLMSPVTSLFAAIAMSSSMIVNPKVTCEQFIIACEKRLKKEIFR